MIRFFERVSDHIYRHQLRMIGTSMVLLLLSLTAAGWALAQRFSYTHDANVANCRNINELRRQIYIAAIDLGTSRHIAERFLPDENCEDLP